MSRWTEIVETRCGPMVINRFDEFVGRSLKIYGEYSPAEIDLFGQLLRPGDVVVEGGSNIGAHTVELSNMVGPTGVVFAFEPQRLVHQMLCANLTLTECTNVIPFRAALGKEHGTLQVPALIPNRRTNFGAITMEGVQQGEPTMLMTIDGLRLPACRLIKLDIEGMETEALQGAAETIERYRPYLYVENDRSHRSFDLMTQLQAMNYVIHRHDTPLYPGPKNYTGCAVDVFGLAGFSFNLFCQPAEAKEGVTNAPPSR